MSDDDLKYDRMVEAALRGVVRQALTRAAERGLPGNHHFYITFRTGHPGVSLANHLRERFPAEMTIVLQHQYWGLKVEEEGFEVTLSFSDKPERLQIPLAAITAFADPSVRFGLQFEAGREGADADEPAQSEAKPTGTALAPVAPEAKLPAETKPAAKPKQKPAAKAQDDKAQDGQSGAGKKPDKDAPGEVVSLDAFRKK